MRVELKPCLECGKLFKPCATKIDGAVSYKRVWCSKECYLKAMTKPETPQQVQEQGSVFVEEEEQPITLFGDEEEKQITLKSKKRAKLRTEETPS